MRLTLGGVAPEDRDFVHAVYGNFPYVLGFVILLTFVLLMRAFRSIVLPLKAVLLNLISLACALGVVVFIFQQGHGSEAIWGIKATQAVIAWIPLMIFAFLFGLSMDYEVFIVTRIREAYDETKDTQAGDRARPRAHRQARDERGARAGVRVLLAVDRAGAGHQAVRDRARGGRADRRDADPRAARAVADDAARQVRTGGSRSRCERCCCVRAEPALETGLAARLTTLPKVAVTSASWSPSSWRGLPALQQPDWPDPAHVRQVVEQITRMPPLVFAGEARSLLARLADVVEGRAFVLQAGDCAESFHDWNAPNLREKLKIMLQMSAMLTYAASVPVVKVGRIAGQFVKPRSQPTETVGDLVLPSFRGHIVHSEEPTLEARTPDPERMLQAYHQATSTLNLLRAFTKGGFADLGQVHVWTQEFVANSPEGLRYEQIADEIERAMAFMTAIGVDMRNPALHQTDIWASHEALLLDFEEALTRRDSLTGDWYDCSAHFLWVGERTRDPEGAHVQFLAGVHNPVGAKLGPAATAGDVLRALRGAQSRAHPRPAHADHAHGRRPRARRAAAARPRGSRCRPPGRRGSATRCTRTRSAPPRAGRRATSAHIMGEIEGFFAVHRDGGHVARRRPRRDHRRRRHRVSRRQRQPLRGAARRPRTRRSATRA